MRIDISDEIKSGLYRLLREFKYDCSISGAELDLKTFIEWLEIKESHKTAMSEKESALLNSLEEKE